MAAGRGDYCSWMVNDAKSLEEIGSGCERECAGHRWERIVSERVENHLGETVNFKRVGEDKDCADNLLKGSRSMHNQMSTHVFVLPLFIYCGSTWMGPFFLAS